MKGERPDEAKRRAIGETAQIVREAAAKNGHQMTQTQAEARVKTAITRGDRQRDDNHR